MNRKVSLERFAGERQGKAGLVTGVSWATAHKGEHKDHVGGCVGWGGSGLRQVWVWEGALAGC